MAEDQITQQATEHEPQVSTPTGADQAKTDEKAVRTFTQDEVNKAVTERLQRERSKYADYDDLKKAAAKLKEIEDSQKSVEQKAQERLDALEREKKELADQNARLASERLSTLKRMAVVAEANRAGFVDPDDAWALVDQSNVQVSEDGKVVGVAEAIKALADAKPHLLRSTPKLGATNPGHGAAQTGETDAERRARLFGTGGVPFGTLGGGSRYQS